MFSGHVPIKRQRSGEKKIKNSTQAAVKYKVSKKKLAFSQNSVIARQNVGDTKNA